jgi:hypothetical protein
MSQMSYSGDAAEQVVRMSLEGGEVAVKLAGAGAKELALLLYAILKDQKKTKGKTRLTSMLRSGKELKVFAVKDAELKTFCKEAKKYGVLYCVLKDRDSTDGITDVMVRAEDASKINRIFERFRLSAVDMAAIEQDIQQSRSGRGKETPAAKQDTEAFLSALFQPTSAQEEQEENPMTDRATKKSPSDHTSERKDSEEHGIDGEERTLSRPSVRKELTEIKEEQKQRGEDAKLREAELPVPSGLPRKSKTKSKKVKER